MTTTEYILCIKFDSNYNPPFQEIELSHDEVVKIRPDMLMENRNKEVVKNTGDGPTVVKERVFIKDFPCWKAELLARALGEEDRDNSFDGETYWSDWY